ncbi:MAG: hypothetical protein ACI853_002034 [Paracoccaceae bacterium]|jgi:hypothetical protein
MADPAHAVITTDQFEAETREPELSAPMKLARDGVNAFSDVTESLGRVRALQMQMTQDLATFADLAAVDDDADSDPLNVVLTRLVAMDRAITEYCALIGAGDTRNHTMHAEKHLMTIIRNGKTLAAVSTLTRTTAASYGIQTMNLYLENLRRIAGVIHEASDGVLDQLGTLQTREVETLSSCREGGKSIGTLLPQVQARKTALSALVTDEHKAAQTISTTSQSLGQDTKTELKTFISAIQFSDRMAQRLDHMAQMLSYEDPHLRQLAAAQATSISVDITAVGAQVRATIAALSRISKRGAELFSQGAIAATIEHSLSTRAETVRVITADLSNVRRALEAARNDATLSRQTIDAAGEALLLLENGSREVANASVNSSLLAARSGEARGALATLSSEVRDTAMQCLKSVEGSKQALNALSEVSARAQDALINAGNALDASVSAYQGQIGAGRDRLDTLNTLRSSAGKSTQHLLALLDEVVISMDAVDGIARNLGQLSAELSQHASATDIGTPDFALLKQIWDTYTMDEERSIHASFFPNMPGISAIADTAPADDDIDDLFF